MKFPMLLLTAAGAGTFAICDLCRPGVSVAAAPAVALPAARQVTAPVVSTVTLHVEGMTCGGCAIATRRVLERLDGVAKADVRYAQRTAVVTYDPTRITVARMIAAVATLRYVATVVRT